MNLSGPSDDRLYPIGTLVGRLGEALSIATNVTPTRGDRLARRVIALLRSGAPRQYDRFAKAWQAPPMPLLPEP